MKKYITLILIFIPFSLMALDSINAVLMNHAKEHTESEIILKDLVAYLIQPTNNESEKAEVLFYWIAHNIDYDIEAYTSKSYLTNKNNILKHRKGVCADYANLYKRMCDLAKIECYVVSGYAKGYSYSKGDIFTRTNHAWNVVKVDDKFKFVDATWGSGYVEHKNGKLTYIRAIDIEEVLANPGRFSECHLPADPRWQLLTKPISIERFVKHKNFNDMFVNLPFEYAFRDSIDTYKALDSIHQEVVKHSSYYKFNPVEINLRRLIKSLNYAGYKLSSGNYDEEKLKKSIQYFSKAENLCAKMTDRGESFRKQIKRIHAGLKYARHRLMQRT